MLPRMQSERSVARQSLGATRSRCLLRFATKKWASRGLGSSNRPGRPPPSSAAGHRASCPFFPRSSFSASFALRFLCPVLCSLLLATLFFVSPREVDALKFRGNGGRHLNAELDGNWAKRFQETQRVAPPDSFFVSDSEISGRTSLLSLASSEQGTSTVDSRFVGLSGQKPRHVWGSQEETDERREDRQEESERRRGNEDAYHQHTFSHSSSSMPFYGALFDSSSAFPPFSAAVSSPPFSMTVSPADRVIQALPIAFAEHKSGGEKASREETGGKKDDQALSFLGDTKSASELNPPRLVCPDKPPTLPPREEQVRKAYALPLCELPWDDLGPMLGSGTFGRVYPLRRPACTEVTKGFVGRKFAVKIFWLKRKGMMNLFDTISQGGTPSAEQTDPGTIAAIKSEIRSLPTSSSAFRDMVRIADPTVDVEKIKGMADSLTVETIMKEAKTLRTVINTNGFYTEVGETGTIFTQMEKFVQTHRPEIWSTLSKASQEAQASKYAEIGLADNHWSLPLARVLVKDKNDVKHWALLIELFDGDLQPKTDKTGYSLDGWNAKSGGNVVLREIFSSREALIGLTSKLVKPFVVMQNLYSLGHFDIKPPNLLYKYFPGEKGRAGRLSVAAGDFGMAGLLHGDMILRGTLAFMAPEMERVSGGLVAKPSYDVYALALTLASFWTAATELRDHYPWVEKCIKPTLKKMKDAPEFTFLRFASKTGPKLYEADTIYALSTCFAVGGKVEKLYHTGMPLLIRLKLSQMADPEPLARVSMRHARFVFKAYAMLDKLLRAPQSEANAETREEQLKQLQSLHIVQFLLFYLRMEPLTAARDNTQSYRRLARALLDFARLDPVYQAATETVQPLPYEFFTEQKDWQNVKVEVSGSEVDETIRKLRTSLTRDRSLSEDSWADLVDIMFGVSLDGLREVVTRVVYSRKTFLLEEKIGNAVKEAVAATYKFDPNTQLIAEDAPDRLFEVVRTDLGLSYPDDSELGRFLVHRVSKSHTAWATVDRLARQALRLALRREERTRQVYEQLLSGEKPSSESEKAFFDSVFSAVSVVSEANYFGLFWDFPSAGLFGVPPEEMQAYVRKTHLAFVGKMWPVETQKKILEAAVRVTVRGLNASLPASLVDVYATVFAALPTKAPVSPPFLYGLEREEYSSLLFDAKLPEFKEMVAFWATRHELNIAVQTAVGKIPDATKLSDEDIEKQLEGMLPAHLRSPSPARFGWPPEAVADNIRLFIREAKDELALHGPDMVHNRIRVNGRSKPPRRAAFLFHEIFRKAIAFKKDVSVLQFNQFFTDILKQSFDPQCRRFIAEVKKRVKSAPAEYVRVADTEAVAPLFEGEGKDILKLVAVDPAARASDPEPNNCFLWTQAFLDDKTIVVS
ncbi:protein kinase domain protein [Toxoplasma gondii VEG]|uniref:Protein kinase n=2 Tax=Toxoplasma gondii TaxID=5811 RepID=V4Z6L1_TOXGV|nr:protein kinase domain protein [Toxoplasma gondii VEG]CEL71805.1 TPA: protein kinase [Toxoplasma gondii VEG]